jgi:hypothetical protein
LLSLSCCCCCCCCHAVTFISRPCTPPAAAAIEILPDTPEDELPAAMPTVEATNATEPANATAPAPSKSSAAGASYSMAFTVAAVVLGAAFAL